MMTERKKRLQNGTENGIICVRQSKVEVRELFLHVLFTHTLDGGWNRNRPEAKAQQRQLKPSDLCHFFLSMLAGDVVVVAIAPCKAINMLHALAS